VRKGLGIALEAFLLSRDSGGDAHADWQSATRIGSGLLNGVLETEYSKNGRRQGRHAFNAL
jgi:hypothetical protein